MFNQNLVPKETPATMMESSIFGGCYCSLPMNTDEEKKKIFNATNRADASLRECINMPIEMMGLYIEPVEFEAKDDDGRPIEGKTQLSPRMIILIRMARVTGVALWVLTIALSVLLVCTVCPIRGTNLLPLSRVLLPVARIRC